MLKSIVVAHHENDDRFYAYRAPVFSMWDPEQEIIVESCRGEIPAYVKGVFLLDDESNEYKALLDLLEAEEPLGKVLREVERRTYEMDWSREDDYESL